MMKMGKVEGKMMAPLFPRLHVSEADKGGPRAPPRNKMALYEQLSIPSQRFNRAAASSLPLPPYNAGTSVPSASSSQGGGHETVCSSFYVPSQSPDQLADMVNSRSLNGKNNKSSRVEFESRSIDHTNHNSTDPSGSVVRSSSLHPHDFSSTKKSREEKIDDEDDFSVPTFVFSETTQSNKHTLLLETKRLTPLGANGTLKASIQFQSPYEKPLEKSKADTNSRKHAREETKQKITEPVAIRETKEKTVSHQENTNTITVNEKTYISSMGFDRRSCESGAMDVPGCLNSRGVPKYGDAVKLATESCYKASGGNDYRNRVMNENHNRGSDGKSGGSVDLNVDRDNKISDTLVVDTISSLEISPDDVLGIIGQKQFWKARRAIINQQRVFSVQVFELHRLIKVQKLIAESPQLLFEDDNPLLNDSPQKVPDKNPSQEPIHQPQPRPLIGKHKDNSERVTQKPECRTETTQAPTLPSHCNGLNKGPHHLPYGPYSGNPQPHPAPVAPETQPNALCYSTANHWLVPIMSPTEGLIYKPYPGPYPPGAGFMTPIYGNCGLVTGDFMNPAFGVTAPHQQQNVAILSGAPTITQNYMQAPYELPGVNPNVSASAVDQVNPMEGPRPTAQIEQRSRSSCNVVCPVRFNALKDNELQGSTASSPFDALRPFPIDRSAERSHGGEQQTRVIKVVPHNARLATESAARIFRSIQEERQRSEQ